MPAVVDPDTGLKFYELSHRWGYNTPTWPGYEDIKMERITYHAKHGVMTQKFTTVFHTSTHVNAPIHLIPMAKGVGELAMDRFFGSGVILSIPKKKWEQVTADDLEKATPRVEAGDIVVIVTGWHRHYSDSQDYFGRAPGLSIGAAEWLVRKKVKLVAVDTAAVDHPMATSLGPQRNGPQIKYLLPEYKNEVGREAKEDFPDWNPAHKALLAAEIPTIENVGGEVDDILGRRCTLHCMPWYWPDGDACVVRFVAMLAADDKYRVEPGNRKVG